ncbi:hypothetical protein GCM10029963_27490 [Micromonospora andamanensis]
MAVRTPALETFPPLRAWQRKALVEYLRRRGEDFVAVATPGAGKTTFALRIAAELLADGSVEAVTVVAPTEHLKTQWADAAARVGIQLDAAFRNADLHSSADFHGAVVTYAQVGMAPQVHRRRTMTRRTLVILDEIHHAGDSRTWGDGVKAAFEPAVRRLMLTGTPSGPTTTPSRSSATSGVATACCAPGPTRCTATATRCATAWCGRCSSWRTRGDPVAYQRRRGTGGPAG